MNRIDTTIFADSLVVVVCVVLDDLTL